jgi:hypothetical protein
MKEINRKIDKIILKNQNKKNNQQRMCDCNRRLYIQRNKHKIVDVVDDDDDDHIYVI